MRRYVLCAALLFAAGAVSEAADLTPKTIVVLGVADLMAKPDHATVSIGVQTFDKVTVKALDANSVLMRRVLDALRGLNIPAAATQTTDFSIAAVHPESREGYGSDLTKTLGYTVSNTLVVSLTDISKAGEVIDAAVHAGANSSNSVTFEAQNQKDLQDKVLADAVRNARHNAEIMAAAEGAKVGKVVSMANSSGFMPRFPASQRAYYAMGAASPVAPFMPGEVAISADVTVVFAIE